MVGSGGGSRWVAGLARWAAPGALLMAIAWFASGIVAVTVPGGVGPGDPGEPRFYLIEGAHAVGESGMLAALAGVHVHLASRSGRPGSVGFRVAFAGTVLTLLSTVLWIAFAAAGGEGNVLTGVLFALGMLGWLVGLPLLGIATLRADVLPGWFGWLLLAFVPLLWILFFALQAYGVGGFAVGLLWALLAYGLWPLHGTATYQEAG